MPDEQPVEHLDSAEHFIGLMSGTSLDGVDGVVCRFSASGQWQGVLEHVHTDFPDGLREALWTLQSPSHNDLHQAALAGNALARLYAQVCHDLLDRTGLSTTQVRAIGMHGQTIRHQPQLHDGTGYTVQIGNAALLAELTGIDVIADLRSRDVAAGGQGAPLVPAFHQYVFGQDSHALQGCRVIVNIGGISNVTLLRQDAGPLGFDCGPGNALMDHWVQRHHGQAFDAAGTWAAQGQVNHTLLQALLAEPYFLLPPPKSTGRDLFHPAWLQHRLDEHSRTHAEPLKAVDVQATLCEFTATTIAQDILRHAPDVSEVWVCGGGAWNLHLMQRLQSRLQAATPTVQVGTTDAQGLPVMQVEAAAFAWLARQHVHRCPANEPAVTGARGRRVLGACYPA